MRSLELANLSPERIRAEQSRWPNRTLAQCLAEQAARRPAGVAIQDGTRQLTLGQFLQTVRGEAAELRSRGVGEGDIVAYQLPTAIETVVLHYAITWLGAIACPISLLHRERDLKHMLGLVQPRLAFARPSLRGVAYADMLRSAVAGAATKTEVIELLPEQPLSGPRAEPGEGPVSDPNQPLYVVWTSGTSGEPKGVAHTSNTGLCGLGAKLDRLAVTDDDAILVITPLAHHIGIYAMHMLALAGIRLVLMESWRPDLAVELIERLRATFTCGTPTFLVDLMRCETLGRHDVSSLRIFSCGGAPVPPPVVETASEKLPACRVLSSYGTSEEGYVTSVGPEDPAELSAVSDGRPLKDMEVRVLSPERQPISSGQEGDLVVRTPSAFAGYVLRPELTREELLPGGWRWTGDRAVLRPDGTVRITGRSKDIIIRGGINVPVVQVEAALLRHRAVSAVAIVAMPDERLGERACAFVVPAAGQNPALEDLKAFLAEQGLAPVYWPERLELIEQLPMTASGKIQKFQLRQTIAGIVQAEQA
ncbi:MAG: AMP-binding protein [Chloroflexota bacterium]|nr:AMP-binding protein [Chloroflexota bacterium]